MFRGGSGFPFGFSGASNFFEHQDYEQQDQQQNDNQKQQSGQKQIDNKKYYEILETDSNASRQEIKKCFKKLAKRYYPDMGGNVQKFRELNEAYNILSDPKKRQIYDKYGTKRFEQKATNRRIHPTRKTLQITLEQIYNGDLIGFQHQRTRVCQECKGKGGVDAQNCIPCKGSGVTSKFVQLSPGMFVQTNQVCGCCQGQKLNYGQQGRCSTCQGKKIVNAQKVVQIPIEKGIPDGQSITLTGQGNQISNSLSENLICIIQQKPHDVFKRQGADLKMKKIITLQESLCGFCFQLKHLDDHIYIISSQEGQIISDSSKKIVKNLGMPFYKDPMRYGNLIIQFNVEMPKRGQISKQDIQILSQILQGNICKRPQMINYEILQDFDQENTNTNEQGEKKTKIFKMMNLI